MKLSIIIVNYNTYTLTKQTLASIIGTSHPFSYEIILVDNNSMDDSMKRLMEDFEKEIEEGILIILINRTNEGFARANNKGIRKTRGEYILLLNSDTEIMGDCLEKSLEYIQDNPRIGVLGSKVVLPDGTLDHACKRGFPTPSASLYYFLGLDRKNPKKYGQYDALHLSEDDIGEVDSVMGAFMLMPRRVLDEVGLLDENFFMYGEDIDLCYRIKEAGYQVIYYPKGQIIHYKGGSSKKKRNKIIYDFHHAMWIFYKKHYWKKYSSFASLIVFLGIWIMFGLSIVKNVFLRKR